MKRHILVLLQVLWLIVAAAIPCNAGDPDTVTTTYISPQGQRLTARFGNEGQTVTVWLPDGRSVTLPLAMSGSGARYSDGKMTFWEHQGGAMFLVGERKIFDGQEAAPGKVLDAVAEWGNGKAYFFKGNRYLRYDIRTDRSDPGYPKPVNQSNWPGVPWTSFDAVANWGNGKAYLFKGSQYIRYDIRTDRADQGYPKPINQANWRGLPWSSVDAVVNWGNGKAYFFKGDQYLRYDIRSDKADPGYPQQVNQANWPGLPWTSVDAVANWGNGKAYFFKGNEYIRYDIRADRADQGYPKPINDANWPGISGLLSDGAAGAAQPAASAAPGGAAKPTGAGTPGGAAKMVITGSTDGPTVNDIARYAAYLKKNDRNYGNPAPTDSFDCMLDLGRGKPPGTAKCTNTMDKVHVSGDVASVRFVLTPVEAKNRKYPVMADGGLLFLMKKEKGNWRGVAWFLGSDQPSVKRKVARDAGISGKVLAELGWVEEESFGAAPMSCKDLEYDTEKYHDKMDELAARAHLPDKYWNRYHADAVSDLCGGRIKDIDSLVDNGYVDGKQAQEIASVLGKSYTVKKRSEAGKRYGDARDKFLGMGACSACAANIAEYYVKKPSSPCGKLAKQALEGNREAVKKVVAYPDFCVWE